MTRFDTPRKRCLEPGDPGCRKMSHFVAPVEKPDAARTGPGSPGSGPHGRVVLVQIRDGESEASRRREAVVDSYPSLVERGLQFATSPPEGLWQSRVASNVFRNDNLIHTLTELFQARGLPADFFATATFEFVRGEDVSLSFVLTEVERAWVAEGARQVSDRVGAVVDWWHERLRG